MSQQLQVHRFSCPVVVKSNRQSASRNQRDDRKRWNNPESVRGFFDREREEVSRENCESAERRQNREHDQRDCHYRWWFVALTRDVAAWPAEKYDDEQANHIESGQECRKQRHGENRRVALVGECKNCVLAKKSTKRRAADQRQRAYKETGACDWEFSGKVSHLPDVLFVMQHHDDGAGGEEEKRFEKCVRKKMEHGRVIWSETDCHHHVTKLWDGGVGENTFDVVLLRCD